MLFRNNIAHKDGYLLCSLHPKIESEKNPENKVVAKGPNEIQSNFNIYTLA